MLAVLLHMALGLQSAGHQLRMAAGLSEICTVAGTGYAPVAGDAGGQRAPSPTVQSQGTCFICAAAAFQPLSPTLPSKLPPPAVAPFVHIFAAPALVVDEGGMGLPPVRAPPVLS